MKHRPPYIIAEAGSNHGGDLNTCLEMVRVAADCGASAFKLQKRDLRTLYTKAFYNSPYNSEQAFGPTYGLHREALEFGKREFCEVIDLCDRLGIEFLCTAFDFASVDFLRDLEVRTIKIASGDLQNTPLISYASQFASLIISTGGGSMDDVHRAVLAAGKNLGGILHCTAIYPAPYETLNLSAVRTLSLEFPNVNVGASLHCVSPAMAVLAYGFGARIIEMHFTLDRSSKGTDHSFSLEPNGLRKLVKDLRHAAAAIGGGEKVRHPDEAPALQKMSKSVYTARALRAGHTLSTEDLAFRSPGGGLKPYQVEEIVGKTLTRDLDSEHPLQLQDVKDDDSRRAKKLRKISA